MTDGLINIYKEPGYTSNDVVARLRGMFRQRKVGHTGTLDPAAEGVLPVCLGNGTKLVSMLTDETKTYRATLLLGITTDTEDTTGTILTRAPEEKLRTLAEDRVREAVLSFEGHYMQTPPMYSALKRNGVKLVDLARRGITVERKPRPVTIHAITVDSVDLPRVTMTVTCSRGTYIRTLCGDIGAKLGVGGAMEKLVRTRVGRFSIEDALRLDEVQKLTDEGRLSEAVLPTEEIFRDLPGFCSESPDLDRMLDNGNPIPKMYLPPETFAGQIRVHDSHGRFIGIFEYSAERGVWLAVRIFL